MPIHLKVNKGDIASHVLLPGDPERTEFVAQRYLGSARLVTSYRGLVCYTGKYKGLKVTVATSGMGCPSAAIVVEELAKLGAKVIIRAGTCGGVPRNVKPGDYVVPTATVPLTGILSAYGLKSVRPVPHPDVMQSLRKSLSSVRHHVGTICTSDAFYKEKEQAREWEKKGVLAFEMECAAVFAVSHLRGIKAGAILTTTGSILYGRQVMDTRPIQKAVESMCRYGLDGLRSL